VLLKNIILYGELRYGARSVGRSFLVSNTFEKRSAVAQNLVLHMRSIFCKSPDLLYALLQGSLEIDSHSSQSNNSLLS